MSTAGRSAADDTAQPGPEPGDEPEAVGPDAGAGATGAGGGPAGDDWGRQLSRREKVFWYGLAAVSYVGCGVVQKGLLNWFVGPLWLVAVIWLGPLLTDQVRRRRRARTPVAGARAGDGAGPDVEAEAGGPAAP